MKYKIVSLLIIHFTINVQLSAAESCLDSWREFSRSAEKVRLTSWMKTTAKSILYKQSSTPGIEFTLPAQPDCTGLFVTLIKKGKVRGCFGAFSHSSNDFSTILKSYLKGALFLDPRHKPVERDELDDIDIVLTVASRIEPVDDPNKVDISNFGLFIDCDDSANFVIVPAEYRTVSGIDRLTGRRGCRFYKFRAVTLR